MNRILLRQGTLQKLLLMLVAVLFMQTVINFGVEARSPDRLQGECRQLYNKWLKLPGYGAYASSKNGLCNYNTEATKIDFAVNDALRNCKRRKGALGCRIIATNKVPGKYASNTEMCAKNGVPKVSLGACDWIIKSGKLNNLGRAWAYAQRGYGYMNDGKVQLAAEDFESSLKIKKDFDFAREGLASAKNKLAEVAEVVATSDNGIKKARRLTGWYRADKRKPQSGGIYDGEKVDELAALSQAAAESAADSKAVEKLPKTWSAISSRAPGQPEGFSAQTEFVVIQPVQTASESDASWYSGASAALAGTAVVEHQVVLKAESQGPIVADGKTAFGDGQINQLPDLVLEAEGLNDPLIVKLDNEKICKVALNSGRIDWDNNSIVRAYVRVAKSRSLSVYHCQRLLGFNQTVIADVGVGKNPTLGRRVALVIGNSSYPEGMSLPNPTNDAKAIAASLGRLGFEVIISTDATKAVMTDAMYRFAISAEGADAALVFYAGHGMQVDGVNYLMPIDATLETQADLKHKFVAADEILDDLKTVKGMRMVVLDACRNNPLSRSIKLKLASMTSRLIDNRAGLADMKAEGVLIAFATQPNEVAADGEGADSPFTLALLKHLETPNIEIDTMFKRVRTTVSEMTEGVQLPQTVNSSTGEFYLKQN